MGGKKLLEDPEASVMFIHFTSAAENVNMTFARIDLSTVDRESLPIGVSRTFGSRMKLDARLKLWKNRPSDF